jgi:hypothetical protein
MYFKWSPYVFGRNSAVSLLQHVLRVSGNAISDRQDRNPFSAFLRRNSLYNKVMDFEM